ncbi:MAG: thioredoxin domain-containing protein [Deltaproteobacteria bacterium]|nr:thioredoxin domain-containing protein [Deltaproteobacteria bacterium]
MGKTKPVKKNTDITNTGQGIAWKGWFVIAAALAGLGICLYLYSFHIALLMGEIKSGLLCGADNGLGCNSVSSSPYGSFLGLPLALWGAISYVVLALLGVGSLIFKRDDGEVFLRWAFFLTVLALAVDLYLAHAMLFRIRAVCGLCLATYGINFAIFLGLVKSLWRPSGPRNPLRSIFPGRKDEPDNNYYYRNIIKGLLNGAMLLTAVIVIAGSQFITRSVTGNERERLVKVTENLFQQKPHRIDATNRPYLGSMDATVTVVEFSDFLCPYCAKAAKYLKLAGAGNYDKARFVFRHYPLDKSCNRRLSSNVHPGACLLAEGAVCAQEQDKFWDYHDIAFETKSPISRSVLSNIAAGIGLDINAFDSCLNSGRGLKVVNEDIKAAVNAGVTGTPTIFINGRRLRGVPKPWVVNELIKFGERNPAPTE